MLSSTGNTDRLRYLHQQLVVLRGVALDGVVVTLLCLFGFCAQNRTWGRVTLFVIAGALLGWSIYALRRHLLDHWHNIAGEPPSMEIVLIAIGVAGLGLTVRDVPRRPYRCAFMFSAVLTLLAYAGSWYSEVVYNHTVIFFFYAHAQPVGTMIQWHRTSSNHRENHWKKGKKGSDRYLSYTSNTESTAAAYADPRRE